MGNSRWSGAEYQARSVSYATKSREEIFQKRSINEDFDPRKVTFRESCDSDKNPNSTALIFGLDVTGSMGMIAERIAKEGLGTLVGGMYEREPVTDPHLMMMAIGDVTCDSYPLQVTQFEADIRIADQLVDLYLEGGGGGNHYESYDLAWAFAATKTKIDCWNKRQKKGYLFTIGDEMPPVTASNELMKSKAGVTFQSRMKAEDVLAQAQETYDVFHVVVEEGSYVRRHGAKEVYDAWHKLLGKRTILLSNHNHISEVILSVIEVSEGKDPEAVIDQWPEDPIKESVRRALYGFGGQ